MTHLAVRELRKSYGGITALAGAALEIERPGIYGLIGPNGAGKTTLFDIIAGATAPDAGQVLLDGLEVTGLPPHRMAALGVARTFQECRLLLEETCLDNVLFAAQRKDFLGALGQCVSRSQAARGGPPPPAQNRQGRGWRAPSPAAPGPPPGGGPRRPPPPPGGGGGGRAPRRGGGGRGGGRPPPPGCWRSSPRSSPRRRCSCSTSRPRG